MARTKKSRARHEGSTTIYKKNPGICLDCGEFVQHLYSKMDGSGNKSCYPCKKANK